MRQDSDYCWRQLEPNSGQLVEMCRLVDQAKVLLSPLRMWLHNHTVCQNMATSRAMQNEPNPTKWHMGACWILDEGTWRGPTFLDMRIEWDRTKKILLLSQTNYIRKVLRQFNMDESKLTLTPLPTSIRLSDKGSPSIEVETEQIKKIPYASAIGSLLFAMVATWPDLAYVIGTTSCCHG